MALGRRPGCFAPLAVVTRTSSEGSPSLQGAGVPPHRSHSLTSWAKVTSPNRPTATWNLLRTATKLQSRFQKRSRSQNKKPPRFKNQRSTSTSQNQPGLRLRSAYACPQAVSLQGSGKTGRETFMMRCVASPFCNV